MKFKKSMLIICLIICLFSIASVSASDDAIASDDGEILSTTGNNLKTIEDEKTINTTDNEEILSLSDGDEFLSAENDLDALGDDIGTYSMLYDEIGNGGNIKLNYSYYSYDFGYTIEITADNSVIDGNGAVIDMAGSNIRAFNVTASNVIIKNLKIINANATESGAAIFFNKTGFVENCNFTNNTASGSYSGGGAICFNSSANVINCNFVNNTVSSLMNGGGAIYFINGSGNVINCNFTNNVASGTFNLNRGGAIDWVGADCNVSGCRFVNNFADSGGSAISWSGINGNLSNCVFVNNSGTKYDGGAVCFFENGYVTDCIFMDNSIARNGGALMFYGYGNVANCIFVNNAAKNGGAVFFSVDADLTNCNFTNNSADNAGGAVNFYENGDVTNCIFADNKAGESSGGAVIFYEDGGFVSNCNFTNCSAAEYGGAVHFDGDGAVSNCNFTNCSASEFGGAVCFFVNGDVSNCNFTNNQAPTAGGVFFYGNGDATNSNFINNSATTAGAVYLRGNGEISNCNFTDNSATTAGAVYLRGNGEISNCNFTDNSAETAGAVYIRAGGKLCTSNLTNNTATNGSAVYINENGVVENCSFNDNTAMNYGGAVYINERGVVTDCSFVKNSAEYAGALFINGTVGVTNCNLSDNKATDGGAIYWNGTDGVVSGCSFVNNNAGNYGGAIYWNGTEGKVSDCIFVYNSADEWGGAIYWRSVNGSVSDCSFVNNSADSGGAIKWQRSNGSVSDCSFVNNSADSGGAIWWTTFNGVVSGCVFVNNSGGDGVIYFSNGKFLGIDLGRNLTINDNIFLNNDGPAINFYANDSTSNADYNWFGNNATNYNVAPDVGIDLENWYFLDIDLLHNLASISLNNLYNKSNGETVVVDDYRLPVINLTLTGENVTVQDVVAMENGVADIPISLEGRCVKLTASYYAASYTTSEKFGDFKILQEKIDAAGANAVIELDRNYTYSDGIDSIAGGILISYDNVTVKGNGFTINANGKSRIFNVAGENVALNDITFVNGNDTGSGGAIYLNGNNIDVYDCIFFNNTARNQGGAIYCDGDDLSAYNCKFINNSASIENNGKTAGGAIYCNGNNFLVENCNFINNTATDNNTLYQSYSVGGAIYCSNNTGSINGCNFTNNTAKGDGGAIYCNCTDCPINNCNFYNNTGKNGGAICFEGDGTVSNCKFEENFAERKIPKEFGLGDKTYLEGVGGAIYFEGVGEVFNSTFYKNGAIDGLYKGGAIYFNDAGVVANSKFYKNICPTGTAIYSYKKTLEIRDTEFLDNKAGGGWVELSWSVKLPSYITIKRNCANNFINAIYKDYGNVTLSNVTYWDGEVVNSDDGHDLTRFLGVPLNISIKGDDGNTYYNASYTAYMDNGQIIVPLDIALVNYVGNPKFILVHNDDDYYYYFGINLTLAAERNISSSAIINTVENEFIHGDCYINFTAENCYGYYIVMTDEDGEIVYEKINRFDASAPLDDPLISPSLNKGKNYTDLIFVDLPAGYYNITVNSLGSLLIIGSSVSKMIRILPLNSTINVDVASEVVYNNTVSVNLSGKNLTTVNVTVYDSDKNIVFTQNTTESTLTIPVLPAGTYNITAVNYGNQNISGCENSTILNILKASNNVVVSVDDVSYGEDAIVVVTADIDGNYTVNINGTLKTVEVVNGNGNTSILLNGGSYWANASFDDPNYESIVINAAFNVLKLTTNITAIDVNTTYGVNKDILITLKDSKENPIRGAQITVELGGENNYTTDANGQVKVATSNLSPGTYTANITFEGNRNYAESNTAVTVTVSKVPTEISIVSDAVDLKIDDEVDSGASLTPADAGILTYASSNESVAKVENGKIKAVGVGSAVITVSFAGNEQYAASEDKTIVVNVSADMKNTTLTVPNVDATYGEVSMLVAVLTDVDGNPVVDAKIKFAVSGGAVKYIRTGADGKAALDMSKYGVGRYWVTVTFVGTELYGKSVAKAKFIASPKKETSFVVSDLKTLYGSGDNLTATLKDENGNAVVGAEVLVDFNGGSSTLITDDKGQVSISTEGLNPDDYVAYFTYAGDRAYEGASASANIVVGDKLATTLTVPFVNATYGDDSKLVATLTDEDGNAIANAKIKFAVSGGAVKYIRTDANGQAALDVSQYAVGNYWVTITFLATDLYNKSVINSKIFINEA